MTSTVYGEDTRAPVRGILSLGLPFLVGALSSTMSGVVDTAMMGRYSANALAAVSGASSVFDIFASVLTASVSAYQILSARFAGMANPAGIRRTLRASLVFCGVLALVLTLLCLVAGGWLTGLVSDGNPTLEHIGAQYLTARAPTLLLLVPFTMLAATFNAYKKPRYAMTAGIAVNILNLLLDWLLIYGPGSLPALGAAGNGLATTLSWLVGLAILGTAARRFGLPGLLRQPGRDGTPDFETSVPKLAWPAMVSAGLDYTSTAIFFVVLGGLGTAVLGGGRIAFQVMVLLFGLGSAFSSAIRILVGRSLGAGEPDAARVFRRAGRTALLGPGVLLAVVLVAFARPVALAFTDFGPILTAAAAALPLIGLCAPLMAWTLSNVGVVRAHGKTTWDMYGNLASAICVQLPIGWLFADVFDLGIAGAYGGVLGYWLVRAVITEAQVHRLIHRPG